MKPLGPRCTARSTTMQWFNNSRHRDLLKSENSLLEVLNYTTFVDIASCCCMKKRRENDGWCIYSHNIKSQWRAVETSWSASQRRKQSSEQQRVRPTTCTVLSEHLHTTPTLGSMHYDTVNLITTRTKHNLSVEMFTSRVDTHMCKCFCSLGRLMS